MNGKRLRDANFYQIKLTMNDICSFFNARIENAIYVFFCWNRKINILALLTSHTSFMLVESVDVALVNSTTSPDKRLARASLKSSPTLNSFCNSTRRKIVPEKRIHQNKYENKHKYCISEILSQSLFAAKERQIDRGRDSSSFHSHRILQFCSLLFSLFTGLWMWNVNACGFVSQRSHLYGFICV